MLVCMKKVAVVVSARDQSGGSESAESTLSLLPLTSYLAHRLLRMHASSPSRAELGQQFPPPPSSPKEKSNEEWNGSSSDSNTKATAAGISASPRTIPPFVIIGAWIALSSAVILYKCVPLTVWLGACARARNVDS